jgi:putative acetyltransferase
MHSREISIIPADSDLEIDAVRTLFAEYAKSLRVDLCFQNFDHELRQLPGEYSAPRGCLVLASVEGEWAGCCAMRPLDSSNYSNACEMKRLYVRPQFRGVGLGKRLADAVLEAARVAAYNCILLDTLDDMESARALYEELGFVSIPPYYYNPIAGAHYLKADL